MLIPVFGAEGIMPEGRAVRAMQGPSGADMAVEDLSLSKEAHATRYRA